MDARVLSLEVLAEVERDGTIEVEQRFSLQVDGEVIKRGPLLKFLTVFKGPGGLVLDNQMKILEVLRGGASEEFHETEADGLRNLYCGSPYVTLEPGVYDYVVRYSSKGDWIYRENSAYGAFDMTGSFSGLPIDQLSARVRLPEGVEATQFSAAVTGYSGEGAGYIAKQERGDLFIKTDQPLASGHTVFLNVVWPAGDFATRSRWLQVMQQYPKIPITVFAGVVLLWAFFLVLAKGLRRARRPATV